jgi:predicted DNA-binding transcriptional regulator YafY
LEDGTYKVEVYLPDDEGLKKFILSFGDQCEVIAPEKLRKEIQIYINSIYEKYSS